MLTEFISGCRKGWALICGTSWFHKSKTEKVTGGGKSAILPNWCCLLFITVLSGYPWFISFPLNSYLKTILFLVKDFKEKEMAFSTERFHQKFLQKDDNKWAIFCQSKQQPSNVKLFFFLLQLQKRVEEISRQN